MARPQKKKATDKKSTVDGDKKQYALSLVLLLFIIFSGISAFFFYGTRGAERRDEDRQKTVEEVIQVIESHYTEKDKYPEAIFFTSDRVLVCSSADCFDEKEVPLSGATRAADFSERTTSKATKYGYILEAGGYGIGYCDEDGEVVSFGNIHPSNLMLNCN